MNDKKMFLNSKQVSEYLCVPLRTVHRLTKQGYIKAFKIGGQWRYLKSNIEKFGPLFNKKHKANFITAKEVSEYLSIPVRTIRYLSKQGKIKSFKLGKKWRYLRKDIEQYSLNNTGFSPSFRIDFSKEPEKKPSSQIPITQDRRLFPRINCSVRCDLKVFIPFEKELVSLGRILNISQGGVFIKNDSFEKISADDPIELKFRLNRKNIDSKLLNVEGRVVRKEDIGFAVKFRDVSILYKNIITEYVG